jgi:hypothetical protein
MESVAPNSPPPPEHAVHGACEPDRRSHEAARETGFVVGLDEQVNVIGLNRVVNDSKPRLSRSSESAP